MAKETIGSGTWASIYGKLNSMFTELYNFISSSTPVTEEEKATWSSKVDDNDPRLSDPRTPTEHTHQIEDIEGLSQVLEELPAPLVAATAIEVANATNIDCWGDSLTQGEGTLGASYPGQLATLTNANIWNDGIEAQTSTQVKARFDAAPGRHSYGSVIWVGKNDVLQGLSMTTLKANIAAMVSALGHDRYLVLGVTPSATDTTGTAAATTINTLNSELATIYGERFIDVAVLLKTKGTGTGQDATDVANGLIPASLRVDAHHFSTAAYGHVAAAVSEKMPILLGPFEGKTVTLDTISKASESGKREVNLSIGGKYRIGGSQVAFLPDQNEFLGSVFYGSGGRFLTRTTGSTGQGNVVVGPNAGYNITTGHSNAVVGNGALTTNTTGASNVAFGNGALFQNTSGGSNVAIGLLALGAQTTVSNNTAVGTSAASAVTGADNVALGSNAMTSIAGGNSNTVIGMAGMALASGASSFNTVIGKQSFLQSGVKNNNTGLGYQAGFAATTASNNIAIGFKAADNITTGNNNVVIGVDIDVPVATGSNQLVIGNLIFGQGVSGTGTTKAGTIGIGIEAKTTSMLSLPGGTTGVASVNIPDGVAPTNPVDGDVWFVGDVMYRRIGGVTKSLTFA